MEGKARLQKLIDDVLASGVYISVSVDIWGENGISLFGIMATFVDKECQLRNVLLRAAPMSTSRHTALNIWALLDAPWSSLALRSRRTYVHQIASVPTA